jgi:aspartate 1-decarboxylase
MLCTILKSKIHRATVTDADVDYEGSVTIDALLMEAAGIHPYEKVQVVAVGNGARLETYAIPGPEGSGVIQINGAAARLIGKGETVILMAYTMVADPPPADWKPTIVWVDAQNRMVRTSHALVH